MNILSIDHFVLTVADLDATINFYTAVLGMRLQHFGTAEKPRVALSFGKQKINLHEAHSIPDPNVLLPTPGSADFCLVTDTSLADWTMHLQVYNVPIIEGPVYRTGAIGDIRSIYIRDPDRNLIEIAEYL